MIPPDLHPHITTADPSRFREVMDLVSACRDALIAGGIHQWDEVYPRPASIVRDIEKGQLFIAELDGRLVGAVALDQEQEPEYAQVPWLYPPPCLVIHRLCVSPASQGQGIGSALMRFAEQCAMDRHLGSIRLDVYSGNPRAMRLYEHLGYRIAGRFSYPSRDLPFQCMEKRIHPGANPA